MNTLPQCVIINEIIPKLSNLSSYMLKYVNRFFYNNISSEDCKGISEYDAHSMIKALINNEYSLDLRLLNIDLGNKNLIRYTERLLTKKKITSKTLIRLMNTNNKYKDYIDYIAINYEQDYYATNIKYEKLLIELAITDSFGFLSVILRGWRESNNIYCYQQIVNTISKHISSEDKSFINYIW